jgi:hypothetical protein
VKPLETAAAEAKPAQYITGPVPYRFDPEHQCSVNMVLTGCNSEERTEEESHCYAEIPRYALNESSRI